MASLIDNSNIDPVLLQYEENNPLLPMHIIQNPGILHQEPRILSGRKLTDAQKISHDIQHAAEKEKRALLMKGLDDLLVKHGEEMDELAKSNFVHPDYLRKLQSQPHFKVKREVNLENAKIHAKAKEVNGGTPIFI